VEKLEELLDAGMCCVRLNTAHGDFPVRSIGSFSLDLLDMPTKPHHSKLSSENLLPPWLAFQEPSCDIRASPALPEHLFVTLALN
jgi:hypothetical protein